MYIFPGCMSYMTYWIFGIFATQGPLGPTNPAVCEDLGIQLWIPFCPGMGWVF